MRPLRLALLALVVLLARGGAAEPAPGPVRQLKVTILSTMLADGEELGEWGFAALIEVDGHRLLFDTGMHPDLVLRNARSLGVDLTTVPEVILSHHHGDHTGGLMTLREAVRAQAPAALARAHVAEGIFASRQAVPPQGEENPMMRMRPAYETAGGTWVVHRAPVQLYPGVWLTGPVPRHYPERNWSGQLTLKTETGAQEDNLPEDMALVLDTAQGLVVVTGCGHAGIVNIVEYARSFIRPAPIHALVGGIHLFAANEETVAWTAGMLSSWGVENFIGAHCTGVETVFQFRRWLGLDRAHAVVGAVGASFELGPGIKPRAIAR